MLPWTHLLSPSKATFIALVVKLNKVFQMLTKQFLCFFLAYVFKNWLAVFEFKGQDRIPKTHCALSLFLFWLYQINRKYIKKLFHERTLDMSTESATISSYPTNVGGIIVLLNTKDWIKYFLILFSTDSSFRPFSGNIFPDKSVSSIFGQTIGYMIGRAPIRSLFNVQCLVFSKYSNNLFYYMAKVLRTF